MAIDLAYMIETVSNREMPLSLPKCSNFPTFMDPFTQSDSRSWCARGFELLIRQARSGCLYYLWLDWAKITMNINQTSEYKILIIPL